MKLLLQIQLTYERFSGDAKQHEFRLWTGADMVRVRRSTTELKDESVFETAGEITSELLRPNPEGDISTAVFRAVLTQVSALRAT